MSNPDEIVYTKKCERCGTPIPPDYVNALCGECYGAIQVENELRDKEIQEQARQETLKNPNAPTNPSNVSEDAPIKVELPQNEEIKQETMNPSPDLKFGITDPNYVENPEMDDKDQILANLAQFIYTHNPAKKMKGKLLWYPTRNMYTYIKNQCIKKVQAHAQFDKQIWKPNIVDVGCGSGVGSNILSQEAHFVWGIDKNEWSIEFAQEAFTREKNGIYYSPQVTFDVFDIMQDSRQVMQFDMVVAIEIIEHIYDTDKFLRALQRFTKKDKKGNVHVNPPTEFYISTPNRNSKKIRKDHPDNTFHCREWTKKEMFDMLSKYFEQVELYDNKGTPIPDLEGAEDLVLAKCCLPKL
jgi:ubiquinone/menaquinone biosynthesis C-methylase UbiE